MEPKLRLLLCDDNPDAAAAVGIVLASDSELAAKVKFDPKPFSSREGEGGDWIASFLRLERTFGGNVPFPYHIVVTDMNFTGNLVSARLGSAPVVRDPAALDSREFEGLEILRYVKKHFRDVEVIVLSGELGTVTMSQLLDVTEDAQIGLLHASYWIRRDTATSEDPAYNKLAKVLRVAVARAEEAVARATRRSVVPEFDVVVVGRDPLTVDVKKKPSGQSIRFTFDEPKRGLVFQVLCAFAPTFVPTSEIASRVRGLLGQPEAVRMSRSDLDWFFAFHNCEPPCGRQAAKVAACDFDPFLMTEQSRASSTHPCGLLPICPFDVVRLPVDRAAYENLRRDRLADENVRSHVYQIKQRVEKAVEGFDDAQEWRDRLLREERGKGYALAATVTWPTL